MTPRQHLYTTKTLIINFMQSFGKTVYHGVAIFEPRYLKQANLKNAFKIQTP